MRYRAENLTPEQAQMLRDLNALGEEQEKAAEVAKQMAAELEKSGMSWMDILSVIGVGVLALLALM